MGAWARGGVAELSGGPGDEALLPRGAARAPLPSPPVLVRCAGPRRGRARRAGDGIPGPSRPYYGAPQPGSDAGSAAAGRSAASPDREVTSLCRRIN